MEPGFAATYSYCPLNNFLYLAIQTSSGPRVEFIPTVFPELADYFVLNDRMITRIEREHLCPPRK